MRTLDIMTDKQFEDCETNLIKLIIEYIKHSNSKDEALEKVNALLNEKQGGK